MATSNQKKGSGFINLQDIVKANQGNQLGQKLTQGVSDTVQAGQSTIQSGQQQFQSQLQNQQKTLDQQRQGVTQALSKVDSASEKEMALDNKDKPSLVDSGDINQFSNLRSAVYQGPRGLQNSGQVTRSAQELSDIGSLSNSSAGRQELLRRYAGVPSGVYSQRKRSLDELLLGDVSGLQAKGREAQRLSQTASGANEQATNQAKIQESALNQLKTNANKELSNRLTGISGDTSQRAEALRLQQQQQTLALREALDKGQISKQQAQLLGLDPLSTGFETYGLGSTQLLDLLTPAEISQGTVATEKQRAQLQALAQLSGQDLSAYAPSIDLSASSVNPDQLFSGNVQPAISTAQQSANAAYQNALAGTKFNISNNGGVGGISYGGNANTSPTLTQAIQSLQQSLKYTRGLSPEARNYQQGKLNEALALQEQIKNNTLLKNNQKVQIT